MLRMDEILTGQNQIECFLEIPEQTQLQVKLRALKQTASSSERALKPDEIQLSGSHVLMALASALGTVCLLIWAFVRLWLFGG